MRLDQSWLGCTSFPVWRAEPPQAGGRIKWQSRDLMKINMGIGDLLSDDVAAM